MANHRIPIEARPRFAQRRIALGIPQTIMAAQLGLAWRTYQHFDCGRVKPSKRVLAEVESILTELEAVQKRPRVRRGAELQQGAA